MYLNLSFGNSPLLQDTSRLRFMISAFCIFIMSTPLMTGAKFDYDGFDEKLNPLSVAISSESFRYSIVASMVISFPSLLEYILDVLTGSNSDHHNIEIGFIIMLFVPNLIYGIISFSPNPSAFVQYIPVIAQAERLVVVHILAQEIHRLCPSIWTWKYIAVIWSLFSMVVMSNCICAYQPFSGDGLGKLILFIACSVIGIGTFCYRSCLYLVELYKSKFSVFTCSDNDLLHIFYLVVVLAYYFISLSVRLTTSARWVEYDMIKFTAMHYLVTSFILLLSLVKRRFQRRALDVAQVCITVS